MSHFDKRLKERVGIKLGVKQRKTLLSQIKKGNLPIYEVQANNVYRYMAKINNHQTIIVYNKNKGKLITILYNRE